MKIPTNEKCWSKQFRIQASCILEDCFHRNNLRLLKITISDAPISAAMAAQSDANPANVRTTNSSFTPNENQMFWRIMASVLLEWRINQASFERSSDIKAMSAVSMAASVPTAPIAMPKDERASAGASLTPSPTIATHSYSLTSCSTISTLFSGNSSA